MGSGPTIGQDLDRQDSQPGPRRFTSSLERLHGREVACRTIGAHGRLQDVLVPAGALEDPARRRYFKNMAEQSWRRHYFLERREEIERGGGFKGPGEFRLPALEPIPPMPLAMWPHGDASVWPGKSRRRIIVKCNAKGECSGVGSLGKPRPDPGGGHHPGDQQAQGQDLLSDRLRTPGLHSLGGENCEVPRSGPSVSPFCSVGH